MTAITMSPLAGFHPFFRKELSEWWERRAALVTFMVVSAFGIVGTLDTRIEQWAGDLVPEGAALDPTMNVIGAQIELWSAFAAIFATIGILAQERVSGTLGWTLSKPVSRNALLLSKWTGAVLMLAIFSIVLPLAVSVIVSFLAYGALPDLGAVAKFAALLTALPALYVALNLALATRLDSQAAIAAISIGITAVPLFFGNFLPVIDEIWPTRIGGVAIAVASGEPASLMTIASWGITLVACSIAGLVAFSSEDL